MEYVFHTRIFVVQLVSKVHVPAHVHTLWTLANTHVLADGKSIVLNLWGIVHRRVNLCNYKELMFTVILLIKTFLLKISDHFHTPIPPKFFKPKQTLHLFCDGKERHVKVQ